MKVLLATYDTKDLADRHKGSWRLHPHICVAEESLQNRPYVVQLKYYYGEKLIEPNSKWILKDHLHNWLVEQGCRNYTLKFETITDCELRNGIYMFEFSAYILHKIYIELDKDIAIMFKLACL